MTKKITLPTRHDPGKGYPTEHLAYLTPDEMEMLRRLTDGTISRGPRGVPSFADDSASSKGVSRGDSSGTKGSGSTKTSNGSVSKSSSSSSKSTGSGNKSGVGGGGGGGGGATGSRGSSTGSVGGAGIGGGRSPQSSGSGNKSGVGGGGGGGGGATGSRGSSIGLGTSGAGVGSKGSVSGGYNSGVSGSRFGGASTQKPGSGQGPARASEPGSKGVSGAALSAVSGNLAANREQASRRVTGAPPGSAARALTQSSVLTSPTEASRLRAQYSQYRSPPGVQPSAPNGVYGPRAGIGVPGYMNPANDGMLSPGLPRDPKIQDRLPSTYDPEQTMRDRMLSVDPKPRYTAKPAAPSLGYGDMSPDMRQMAEDRAISNIALNRPPPSMKRQDRVPPSNVVPSWQQSTYNGVGMTDPTRVGKMQDRIPGSVPSATSGSWMASTIPATPMDPSLAGRLAEAEKNYKTVVAPGLGGAAVRVYSDPDVPRAPTTGERISSALGSAATTIGGLFSGLDPAGINPSAAGSPPAGMQFGNPIDMGFRQPIGTVADKYDAPIGPSRPPSSQYSGASLDPNSPVQRIAIDHVIGNIAADAAIPRPPDPREATKRTVNGSATETMWGGPAKPPPSSYSGASFDPESDIQMGAIDRGLMGSQDMALNSYSTDPRANMQSTLEGYRNGLTGNPAASQEMGYQQSVLGGNGIMGYGFNPNKQISWNGPATEYGNDGPRTGQKFADMYGSDVPERVLSVEDVPEIDVPGGGTGVAPSQEGEWPGTVPPSQEEPLIDKKGWPNRVRKGVFGVIGNMIAPGLGTGMNLLTDRSIDRINKMSPAERAIIQERWARENAEYRRGGGGSRSPQPGNAYIPGSGGNLVVGGGLPPPGSGGSGTGGGTTNPPPGGTPAFQTRRRVGNPLDPYTYGYGPSYNYFTYE